MHKRNDDSHLIQKMPWPSIEHRLARSKQALEKLIQKPHCQESSTGAYGQKMRSINSEKTPQHGLEPTCAWTMRMHQIKFANMRCQDRTQEREVNTR